MQKDRSAMSDIDEMTRYDTVLEARNLGIRYSAASSLVLDSISLEVRRGETVTIIGASGCGKSTLLRILSGLLDPTLGSVSIRSELSGDDDQGGMNARIMVFQDLGLLPWRTVRGNVSFGMELAGIDRATRATRVNEFLALVGMDSYDRLFPYQLSGGMAQRTALARALVLKPAVLLLDEPFAALDAQTRLNMQLELCRLTESLKMTTLLVTHAIDEAVFVADRVIVLGGSPSHIVQEFPIDLPKPRSLEVRDLPEFKSVVDEVFACLRDDIVGRM